MLLIAGATPKAIPGPKYPLLHLVVTLSSVNAQNATALELQQQHRIMHLLEPLGQTRYQFVQLLAWRDESISEPNSSLVGTSRS